jgi:hypothetical protein
LVPRGGLVYSVRSRAFGRERLFSPLLNLPLAETWTTIGATRGGIQSTLAAEFQSRNGANLLGCACLAANVPKLHAEAASVIATVAEPTATRMSAATTQLSNKGET